MRTLLPRRLDPRTLAGATLAALAPGLALAGPQGESVVAGAATVGRPDALTTLVTQTSSAAIINWQQFNVGSGEFVVFQQPSSSSVVLNRVVGNDASQIFGSISANGRVFLSNPNGVLFAPGARLDLHGLVATTFGIADDDFMAGRYAFARAAGAPDAGVVNQGAVQTAAGGFVVLAGDFVRNEGVIAAPAGSVVLASGARTTLNLDGMGLVDFAVDEATLAAAAGVSNAGQILAEGGMVVMTARVANQLVGTVVNNSGVVRASRIAEQGGELWLVGEGGDVVNSGTLDASGVDGDAGRVVLLSDRDATHGGAIVADGAGAGAGGEVRAIAAGTLELAPGSVISARGGPDSESAGGMVEVSGHGALHLRGVIDLGTGGALLIDPATVTLLNGASSVAGGSVGSIHVQFINAQLALGNDVRVLASSSINASSSAAPILSTNPSGDLQLLIGTAAPLCQAGIAQGICVSPPAFGTFTAVAGGAIALSGITIDIDGTLTVAALGGTVDLGTVSAGQVAIGTPTERVGSVSYAALSATTGSISIDANDSVFSTGLTDAAFGSVLISVAGGASSASINLSDVSAGGAVDLDVSAASFSGSVTINGSVNAGGAVTLVGSVALGAGDVSVTGNVIGGGLVQLVATDSGGALPGTGVTVSGTVQGDALSITAYSFYTGGHIDLFGSATATGGNIDMLAAGSGAGAAAGAINVAGAVTALGNVSLQAVDNNGYGGGTISIASVAGVDVSLFASGDGIGSAAGGGTIFVGIGSGSNLFGGTVTATGNLTLAATADPDTFQGGMIVVGDTTVTGNAQISVTGGPNGGNVYFADAVGSAGTVTAAATVTVGNELYASISGDAGAFVAGAITADRIEVDLVRGASGSRDIAIATGTLSAGGSGSSDQVRLFADNVGGPGAASVTVNGDILAAGLVVDLRAQTLASGAGVATIAVGDITAAEAWLDNTLTGTAPGTVSAGNITADTIMLTSRGDLTTLGLTATVQIFAQTAAGNIALGDLAANNASNPVDITVTTTDPGGAIGVGAITASGRRSAVGSGDHGAWVTVSSGPLGGDVTVAGPIAVTGLAGAFADSFTTGSPSDGSYATTGTGGGGVVDLRAGDGAILSVASPGGITIVGAGTARLDAAAGTVQVAGPISADASPVTVTTTGMLSWSQCQASCAVNFSESRTNGGDALVSIDAFGSGGAIQLGDVTVDGPQSGIELYGASILTGALSATAGASHYQRSSNGTIGGAAHAFSDDFLGGGAEVLLGTGSGPSGSIQVLGDVTVAGVGYGGVDLAADSIVVGGVTVSATGGVYTRSGAPANPSLGLEGPFGVDFGDGLPPIDTGTITGGFAIARISDQMSSSCSGSCGRPAAQSVSIGGALSANAPGLALIEIVSLDTSIAGPVTALAPGGSRVGAAQYASFDSLTSTSYAVSETIDFTGGAARVYVNGDGMLTVSGTMTVAGAFASIDLGIESGSLGAIDLDITGGSALYTSAHDAAGTSADYTTSFQGPGLLQGFVAGPDSGGSGTIAINGPITVDAVGFGAVIVRAGSVFTGAIDLSVTSAAYQYYDSRIDSVPVNVTAGDAMLAVHQQSAPGAFSRATVSGAVDVTAQGTLFLRSQLTANAANSTLTATGAVTETFSTHLDRLNQFDCDGSGCSLGSYAPVDLELQGGLVSGQAAIALPTGGITFGLGDAGTGADALVSAQFGVGTPNPNGVIKTLGQLDLGHVGLTGSWVMLEAGTFGTIGSASVTAGAVVQFVVAGGGDLQLEQSTTGAGIVSASGTVLPFGGAGAELVFGHSTSVGGVLVGQLGPVGLGAESVTLIGPGGIGGTAPLAAADLTLHAGTGAVALATATAGITVVSASGVQLDNSTFSGATTVILPATGPTSVDVTTGGALNLFGAFTGTSFALDAAGDLYLNDAVTAAGGISLTTGGFFSSGGGTLTTTALTLDGVAGVTDFFVTTDAASISVGDANVVAIDNTARTAATSLALVGTSPTVLDLDAGGALALTGAFAGTDLALTATGIDLGAGAHSATNAMSFTTGGLLDAPALLTASSIVIDAAPGTVLALTTASPSVLADEGASLALDNSAFTGGAVLYLPTGIGSAAIAFGGNGQVNGAFAGTTFDALAAGDLTLAVTGITATTSIALATGGNFSASGPLVAPSLSLDGVGGVTDFAATTQAGAISVDGANGLFLDNSGFTGIATLTLVGTSPTTVDVISGGGLNLVGAFAGASLSLSAADLSLGAAAHTASGAMSFTTGGALVAPALLTAASIAIYATPTSALSLQTATASLSIDQAAMLSLDNSAATGSVSLLLPTGAAAAALVFGGDATLFGDFSGSTLSVTAAGNLDLLGSSYAASGTMLLATGGAFFTSGTLAAGALTLDGVAGVSDFFATTDAGAITIDGADAVAIDNSARTGAATVTLVGASPAVLDVVSGGDLALSGTFAGTDLVLSGANLALGTAAHSATNAMTLTAANGINATGVLTTGSFSATTSTPVPLAFTTNAGSLAIAGALTLSINNNAFTGPVSFALPGGLLVANLAFGGDATVSGGFAGSGMNFATGGDLTLLGSSYSATGTLLLNVGGAFSSSALLSAATLDLRGGVGVTDFFVTTDAAAIAVNGGDEFVIDNSAHGGATTIGITLQQPRVLDVASGGALALTSGFNGGSLVLSGSSLDLGAANHTASSGISLTTGSTLVATGTLGGASLFIDGVPTTTVALTTTVGDLYLAEAGAVTIDATPSTGALNLGFGSGAFGAVNVDCAGDILLNSGATATTFALSATGAIDDGGVPVALRSRERGGEPGPAAVQPRALAGTVVADAVFLEAGGDLLLGATTFAIGMGDGVTGVSDQVLLAALAGAGIGPGTQTVSNGTFLAGGALELGMVTSQGSYLVLQGDALTLGGQIIGGADFVVQIAPATASNTFSVEDAVVGTAATNYTFAGQLDQIAALTIVIGASTMSGDATIGGNGAFDVGALNLIIATSGNVTSIGNVTSTGIVDTLAGLLGGGEPTPPPPILEEIDPGVAEPPPPVDTSAGVPPDDGDGEDDEDDEGEDLGDTGADEGEEDAGLVTQQSATPAGVCGK